MNIEMALNSRSYILDLDLVKFSFRIFFFLSSLTEIFLHQLSGSTFFCQKHTPKSRKFNIWPNFTYGTNSCVVPWRAIYDDIDSIDLNTAQLNTKQINVPLKIQAGHLGSTLRSWLH